MDWRRPRRNINVQNRQRPINEDNNDNEGNNDNNNNDNDNIMTTIITMEIFNEDWIDKTLTEKEDYRNKTIIIITEAQGMICNSFLKIEND